MIKAITTIFGNPVDRALSQLRKLQGIRATVKIGMIADVRQLATLRGRLPDSELGALLEEDGSSAAAVELRRDIAELEGKIAGRARAEPRLLDKIREAIHNVGKARGAILRSQADKLRTEHDAHVAELDRRLAEVSAFAGTRVILDKDSDIPPPGVNMWRPGQYPPPLPRFVLMERQIDRLIAEATTLEARSVHVGDESVTVESVDELLSIADDLERITPPRPAIQDWLNRAMGQADGAWNLKLQEYAEMAWQRVSVPERGLTITLTWNVDGEILPESSSIQNRVTNVFSQQRETPVHQDLQQVA